MSRLILALFASVAHGSDNLTLGAPSSQHQIVDRLGYALGYDEGHEQAAWVSYLLTGAEASSKAVERTDDFRLDPAITTGSANLEDYKGSGFDRGHLAPAGDMTWGHEAMSESFFLSNMSPQEESFNRGIWGKLEDQVRDWAVAFDSLWVITGPVLGPGLRTIGPNQVSVPGAYYKVLYTPTGNPRVAAFLLPNRASKEPLSAFLVSVDSVEAVTGLDFLGALPDDLEQAIEAKADLKAWAAGGQRAAKTKNAAIEKPSSTGSLQCKGTTQKGQRCRNKTLDLSGYCHHCMGKTAD